MVETSLNLPVGDYSHLAPVRLALTYLDRVSIVNQLPTGSKNLYRSLNRELQKWDIHSSTIAGVRATRGVNRMGCVDNTEHEKSGWGC